MASIYKRGKYLYISHHVAGERSRPRTIATGIEWLAEDLPTSEYIEKSKEEKAKQLRALLADIEKTRSKIRFARKHPELVREQIKKQAQAYTFRDLMNLYIKYKKDRKTPLEIGGQRTLWGAVALVEGFDKKATLKSLNESWAERFEEHIYTTDLALSSLNIYIRRLNGLVAWAKTKKWVEENPLSSIKVTVPETDPVHDRFDDEVKFIEWVWSEDKFFTAHYLFERLTGFRAQECIRLKKSDFHFEKEMFDGWNMKIKRAEPWPIHNSLRLLLQLIWHLHDEERLLPFRDYNDLYENLEVIWAKWPMAKKGTHNWKRNYVADIDDAEPPSLVGKLLKHHAPDDLNRRYAGRPMAKMRKWSDIALDKFIPVLERIIATEMQLQSHKILRF